MAKKPKRPKLDPKKVAEAIGKMASKAKELGWSPNKPAGDAQKAIDDPKFVYVKMDYLWGPWKKRGGKGNEGGFLMHWGAEGIGFGELQFWFKKGLMYCDTECMNKRFVKAALSHFLETQVVYDPKQR